MMNRSPSLNNRVVMSGIFLFWLKSGEQLLSLPALKERFTGIDGVTRIGSIELLNSGG